MSEYTPEQRAKLLEKIKKCLALSASPEPHEAAAAMRQAQKLMASLGISQEEAELPHITETTIKTREGYGNCRYMNLLTTMLEEAFGVEVVYSRNPGTANRLNVRYFGTEARVSLAGYTHKVIQRALEEAWAKYLRWNPHFKTVVGKRQSFYMGWLYCVRRKVEAIVPPEEETKATQRFIRLRCGELSVFDERKKQEMDREAMLEGMLAAEKFNINVPIEEEQLKLEMKK